MKSIKKWNEWCKNPHCDQTGCKYCSEDPLPLCLREPLPKLTEECYDRKTCWNCEHSALSCFLQTDEKTGIKYIIAFCDKVKDNRAIRPNDCEPCEKWTKAVTVKTTG